MAKPKYVFFDLDGTLIDHFEAIHESFAYAARELGIAEPSFDKVVATVGGSVPVTASKLFPDTDSKRVVDHFEKRFEEVMYEGVKMNPGAEWILKELREIGIKSVVFTNKAGEKARLICDYLGLSHYLEGIIGAGDTPHRKPEREFSEYALSRFNTTSQTTCLVGDSPFDEASAKVVGMNCHLVATGSHDIETLKRETNSKVYDSLYTLGNNVFKLAIPAL